MAEPSSDAGTVAIDVRTPSSTSLEYARLKVEAAAALAGMAWVGRRRRS